MTAIFKKHNGEKPYVCEVYIIEYTIYNQINTNQDWSTLRCAYLCRKVCSKLFNSRNNRNMHWFVHSDSKTSLDDDIIDTMHL